MCCISHWIHFYRRHVNITCFWYENFASSSSITSTIHARNMSIQMRLGILVILFMIFLASLQKFNLSFTSFLFVIYRISAIDLISCLEKNEMIARISNIVFETVGDCQVNNNSTARRRLSLVGHAYIKLASILSKTAVWNHCQIPGYGKEEHKKVAQSM